MDFLQVHIWYQNSVVILLILYFWIHLRVHLYSSFLFLTWMHIHYLDSYNQGVTVSIRILLDPFSVSILIAVAPVKIFSCQAEIIGIFILDFVSLVIPFFNVSCCPSNLITAIHCLALSTS